jgi:thiol-disulfide isomerase/thioredoxin
MYDQAHKIIPSVIQILAVSLIFSLLNSCASRNPDGSRNRKIAESIVQQTIVQPVELLDQRGLSKIIHERKGKPLLLNIWATWCQPCVEEFPDLIKLSVTDTLVEVVGISVDYPDELRTKVLPFLEKLKVPFKIYIAKFDKQEDFITALDSTWSGAVPATFFYDGKGRKQFSSIGQETFEQFEEGMRKTEKEGSSGRSIVVYE